MRWAPSPRGVLDHLLEDSRLTIEGISGASAGAVNAIMLADGLARGGPEEGRKRLRTSGTRPASAAIFLMCSDARSIAYFRSGQSRTRR